MVLDKKKFGKAVLIREHNQLKSVIKTVTRRRLVEAQNLINIETMGLSDFEQLPE
tara:strand:+ start:643 stop:807 length:165 start_codon:yes stop_codon:yes gene_type:complete